MEILGRFGIKIIWFIRPGVASTFTPKFGMVQEWITSVDEIKIRVFIFNGIIKCVEVSINRVILFVDMKVSNFMFLKSEYS